ncbi:MAG: hypothetical protein Q8L34_02780 [Candidatus Woesearchaeota archaeon]|nr:hypothetical protein [Candidatus Woesearchaeota archaeon]
MQNNSSLAWGIVGLLVLFILFGSSTRGFGCTSYGFMGFGMLFFWIPVLIFLILGTFWFSQQLQHNTKQRRK